MRRAHIALMALDSAGPARDMATVQKRFIQKASERGFACDTFSFLIATGYSLRASRSSLSFDKIH